MVRACGWSTVDECCVVCILRSLKNILPYQGSISAPPCANKFVLTLLPILSLFTNFFLQKFLVEEVGSRN